MFIGWQAIIHGKFILKKGQIRAVLRFVVNVGNREYQINAYRNINVLHDGRLSIGAANQLAKDLSAIAGKYDDGFPVQLDLDDIDLSIFTKKKLLVSVRNTKKKRVKKNGRWSFTETNQPYCLIEQVYPY